MTITSGLGGHIILYYTNYQRMLFRFRADKQETLGKVHCLFLKLEQNPRFWPPYQTTGVHSSSSLLLALVQD